jgi:hypothetical protein
MAKRLARITHRPMGWTEPNGSSSKTQQFTTDVCHGIGRLINQIASATTLQTHLHL